MMSRALVLMALVHGDVYAEGRKGAVGSSWGNEVGLSWAALATGGVSTGSTSKWPQQYVRVHCSGQTEEETGQIGRVDPGHGEKN